MSGTQSVGGAAAARAAALRAGSAAGRARRACAFAFGGDRWSQEGELAARVATHAPTTPDGAALAGLADQLDQIIANGNPEQAKELLRLLVKEIRVHNRRRIVPTYRVPAAVRAIPRKVDLTGQLSNLSEDLLELFAAA